MVVYMGCLQMFTSVPLPKGSSFPNIKIIGCSGVFQNQHNNGSCFSLFPGKWKNGRGFFLWVCECFCITLNHMRLPFGRATVLNVNSSTEFKMSNSLPGIIFRPRGQKMTR